MKEINCKVKCMENLNKKHPCYGYPISEITIGQLILTGEGRDGKTWALIYMKRKRSCFFFGVKSETERDVWECRDMSFINFKPKKLKRLRKIFGKLSMEENNY